MKDYGIKLNKIITGGKYSDKYCTTDFIERNWDYFDWAMMNTHIDKQDRPYISAAIIVGSMKYPKVGSCNTPRKINHNTGGIHVPAESSPASVGIQIILVKKSKRKNKESEYLIKRNELLEHGVLPHTVVLNPKKKTAVFVSHNKHVMNEGTTRTIVKPMPKKRFTNEKGFLWAFYIHTMKRFGFSKSQAKRFYEESVK